MPNASERSPLPRGAWIAAGLAGAAAAALFVAWKVREAEREHPPRGRSIEVDGVRLHYLDRGYGRPVVLLHGLGSSSEDFELSGLVNALSAHHRVIAFDRPGYGYSTRPYDRVWTPAAQARLLHRALQELGVDKPIVVGHSWGALVAAAMALEFPESLHAVVLESGYFYPTPRIDAAVMSGPAIPLIGDALRFTVSPLLARLAWPLFSRLIFSPAPVTTSFKRYPAWLSVRPRALRATAAESAMTGPATWALHSRYRDLRVPTFIVAGRDDRYVSARSHSGRLHNEVPGSRLNLTPGAGHMLHHIAPQEVIGAIEAAATA
jgi:pimeloyl-ACP methyl ester carboxylesterase